MQLLRDALVGKLGGTDRLRTFAKGDVLISEGDSLEGTAAFLVISGSLTERMTRYIRGRGDMHIPLAVPPGAITNAQVLVPHYADLPSMVTIMAEESGELVLLDPAGIRQLEEFGNILRGMLRKSISLIEALWESREIVAELEEAQFSLEWTESELDRERTRYTDLEAELQTALEVARKARAAMLESVTALDTERMRMTYVGIGMELFLDRIREQLSRRGMPDALLAFTAEEKQLFTGEKPANLSALRMNVLRARQIDKIDDDLDTLLDSFDPENHLEIMDPDDVTEIPEETVAARIEVTCVTVEGDIEPVEELEVARPRPPMDTLVGFPPEETTTVRRGIIAPSPTAPEEDQVGRTTAAFEVPAAIARINLKAIPSTKK